MTLREMDFPRSIVRLRALAYHVGKFSRVDWDLVSSCVASSTLDLCVFLTVWDVDG